MSSPKWSRAPAPEATPRIPLPPAAEAARVTAEKVGKEYGTFQADLEAIFFIIFETPFTGGIVLWDRLTSDERRKHLAQVQTEFDKLPKLPVGANLTELTAIREGFATGSNAIYDRRRFEISRSLDRMRACQKPFFSPKPRHPTATAVGSAFTSRFSDCAAQMNLQWSSVTPTFATCF
jgi:hypothetical protein